MPKQLNISMSVTADTSQARKQLQDLQKTLSDLASNSIKNNIGKTMDADLQKAVVSARQLKDMITEASNTKTGNLDLSKFSQEIEKSGRSIQQYAQDLSNLGPEGTKAFMQLAQSVAAAEVPMKRTFGVLDQFKVALTNAARWQISSSVLHGFMGAIQGAYGYAQDLNQSLTNIRIVTGQSTEEMARFADQANKSAQALSTSTLAYTDAALIYYQQGLEGQDVADRVETTLKLSNVTGESADEVSSYMTAIWNNFRKGGETLESFADKITALGAATASSSREIAGGLQQFAAVADTVGLSYDYAASALATVVAQTRQSESTVGNAFRTIFSRLEGLKLGKTLEDGTDLNKYSGALQTIGVNIKDQNGELKQMDTILEEIGAKWQTLSRDQQMALAQTVGGVRQYANLIALFDNWDKFQQNLAVSQGAEGTLDEQAKRYDESWLAAQKRVQAAWQSIYQDLIDDKFFIGLLDNVAKLIQGIDTLIDSVGGLKGVLPIVGSLITTIFAKDLAHGIETAVYNFKVFTGQAEQDANDVARSFQEAGNALAKNLSDQGFEAQAKGLKDQIDFTIKLRENAANITEENRKWLLSLNEITKEYANAWAEAEKLKEAAETNQANVASRARDVVADSVDDPGEKIKAREDVSKALNIENFNSKIEDFKSSQSGLSTISQDIENTLRQGSLSFEEYANSLEAINKSTNPAIDYQTGLRDAIDNTVKVLQSSLATDEDKKKALESLSKSFQEAKENSTSLNEYLRDDAVSAAQRLAKDYELTAEQTKKLVESFKEAADGAIDLAQKTEEADTAQDNYNNRLREAQIEFEQAKNKAASYADQIVATARALSQLIAGFTALGKAWDTLTNKDLELTPLERIQKSIPSLLAGLPMVISGFKNLTKEGTLLGGAMDKVSMVFLEGIASTGKLSGGFAALGKAAVGLMGNLLPILGWLALAAVAVYALKKAWDAFYATTAEGKLEASNKRLKEAQENAEKTAKAYDDLKTTLEDYEKVQEDINKMEPGEDRAEAILEENQKILDYLDENNLWDVINKNGGLQYDQNGLIDLSTQKEVLNNYLLREKSLARQAEYLEKINNLEAQNAVDYNKEYKGSKINIQRRTEHELWSPQEGSSGKTYYATTTTDVTRDIANILNKAGLTASSNQKDIKDALLKSGDEDIINQIDSIMPEISKIANNTELLEKFNDLQQDVSNDNATIEAYKMQSAQAAIGQDVYNATDNALAQQGLFEIFAELAPEMQSSIQDGIHEGGQSLAEAFRQAGVDVAQMIAEAEQIQKEDLTNKIANNGANKGDINLREDVENWVNGLSEDKLKIAAELDIDYDDTLEDVQQKLEDKINNTPVELDTNGLTKKQAEELQQEFEQLTDYITENADAINGLDDHLANCAREASVVARAILRFDDAIQDVTKHYDEWNQALTSGSAQSAAKAAAELQDAYGNLMDMDGSQLSDQFLKNTQYLDLMKQAIEGNEDAYNSLLSAAGEDIIAHLELDPADMAAFQSQLEVVKGLMKDFPNLEVGANLDTGNFLEELTNLVNAAGMTAEQATAYLASMGIDAEVTKVPAETEPVTETHNYWVPAEYEPASIPTGGDEEGVNGNFKYYKQTSAGHWSTPEPSSHEEESAPTAFTLKVTSAHKSSGGAFKYKQASHGGGGVSPSKGKGGGGGGGGSKKKTTKEHTKPVKNEDRYHDIKERIDDLNKSLQRLNKTEDRIYGKAKLKYMDMEIEKLEDQIKLTDEYIAEIKKYAAIDQANLRGIGMGAEFDENGMLTNYEQVLANITNSYNAAIGAYNGAIDVFNGSAQEEGDNEALDNAKKQLDSAKEVYDENQKILKQYEDTYNLLQEQVDKRIDQVWELFDMRLKKITWRIEFELDWNEKELTQFDWLLKYIGKDADHAADAIANLSKQMGVYEESLEWAKQGIAGIFDLHGITFDFDNADPQKLYDQLADFMNAQNLESQLTEKEADALLSYMDAMRDAYDGMYDAWIDAHDHMMKAWDEWQERLQDGLNDIAQYGEELEGIQKIIDLTGRKMLKMTTQDINRMNQALVVNAQEYLRAATARRDALEPSVQAAEAHLQELIAGGASEEAIQLARDEYRKMMEDWQDATNDWYDAFADALQAGENAFNAFIENSTKDYKEGFGKMDLDYMTEQFDRQKKVRDLYLDDYQKYHELNKTVQELNKSLAATNNDLIREKLLDLQNDMNASMQDGVKISSAQAEIYARRVALLQAEAELLDAQNAKSAVRMTRDNEGNFSYTYTADQEQTGEAQNNYGDKFYELLDFERNYADQIQEEMLQSFQDFIDRRNEIAELYKDDQDAYNQAMEELQEEYLAYMDYYVGELDMDFYEMGRLRNDDWLDFEDITGQKLAEHDDFITHFTETITGELTEDYNTAGELAKTWQELMEEACQASTQAVSNYQINTETTYNKAGENIETYGQKVNQKFDEMANKSVNTADAVEDMANDMVNAMAAIQGETYELDNTWAYVMDDMRNQIANTISALQQLMQSLDLVVQKAQAAIAAAQAAAQAQAAADAMKNAADNSSNNGGNGTSNSPGSPSNPTPRPNIPRGGGCFAAGTRILMADYTEKNIEDIQVGDMVIAYNIKENKYSVKKVNKTFIHYNSPKKMKLYLSNGEIIEMTPGHPILTKDGWKSKDIINSYFEHGVIATELSLNDEIIGAYYKTLNIIDIEIYEEKNFTVFNIEVDKLHNFIANNVVVHNMKSNQDYLGSSGFATGGYTGSWGSEGKIAILHEKELVLNKEDTSNMLNIIGMTRDLVNNFNAFNGLTDIAKSIIGSGSLAMAGAGTMDQNVHIEANFPNVQSHSEIEMALNNLINSASQYVNKK